MAAKLYDLPFNGSINAGTIGNDAETIAGGVAYDLFTLAGADSVTTTGDGWFGLGSGDDRFTADYVPNGFRYVHVTAAEGNDTLDGGAEGDAFYGGAGDDLVNGNGGGDTLFGDCYGIGLSICTPVVPAAEPAGADTIFGGGGDDLIVGGELADILNGEEGSDFFVWENDDEFGDRISGFTAGASGDRFFFNGLIRVDQTAPATQSSYVRLVASGSDTIVQVDRDGAGGAHDWVAAFTLVGVAPAQVAPEQFVGLVPAQTTRMAAYGTLFSQASVIGSEWADSFTRTLENPGPDGFLPLYTLAGDDTVSAQGGGSFALGDGNDSFVSPALQTPIPAFGTVFVNGGRGDDTLSGSDAFDSLAGGSGVDSLVGGAGPDLLFGDGRDDQLVFCDLDEATLAWSPGSDVLEGGDDEDLLDGGRGVDTLDGGAGSDVFLWEAGEAFDDFVTDFAWGAGGDRLFFGELIQPREGGVWTDYVQLVQSGVDVLLSIDRDGTGPLVEEFVATLLNTTLAAVDIGQLPGFVDGPGSLVTPGAPALPTVLHSALSVAVGSYWADDVVIGENDFLGVGEVYLLDGDDSVSTVHDGDFALGRGDDRYTYQSDFQFARVVVNGGPGSDTIVASPGDDSIEGGSGADSLAGGDGEDTILGDCLDQALVIGDEAASTGTAAGAGGADTILGGGGADLIVGGAGADDIDGGAGRDLFVFEQRADFGDLLRGFETGASGDRILLNNVIRIAPGTTAVTAYVSKQASGADTDLFVDLDAGGGEFAPERFATLVGVQPASVDIASLVVLGEEFRGVLNNAPTGSVTIGGDPVIGGSVGASNDLADADGIGAISYRWESSANGTIWQTIAGETADVLTLAQSLNGLYVRVVASYTDDAGNAESVASTAIGPLTTPNNPPWVDPALLLLQTPEDTVLQQPFTQVSDDDGDTLTFTVIEAPASGTGTVVVQPGGEFRYTPPQDYFGEALFRFEVSDGRGGTAQGTVEITVENVNDPPTGSLVLAGNPVVGQQLLAFSSVGDVDGLGPGTYQWQYANPQLGNWAPVPGSTPASQLTVTESLVGSIVRYTMSYTDGQGSAEFIASVPTATVTPAGGVNRIDGTPGPDALVDATAGGSELFGMAGNDTLTGGDGNDSLAGGDGIDVAVYAGNRSNYQLSLYEQTVADTVQALGGNEGTDHLAFVERLWFADRKLAIDVDSPTGNAAIVAKILGAVFGPASVAQPALVGIGLGAMDSGSFTYASLMQLALDVRLGAGFTNDQLVVLLFQNLTGGLTPDQPTIDTFTALIGPGGVTQAGLAVIAADLQLNLDNVGFAGLQHNGLEYA